MISALPNSKTVICVLAASAGIGVLGKNWWFWDGRAGVEEDR